MDTSFNQPLEQGWMRSVNDLFVCLHPGRVCYTILPLAGMI